MKNISSKQVVGGFVLSAMALIGSGVPVMAQQSQDANRKFERRQLKIEQRQQSDKPSTTQRESHQQAPARPQVDTRRQQRDIQVRPKERVREPQFDNQTPRTVRAPERTIEPRSTPRRVETQREAPARIETQRTTPRVNSRVDTNDRRFTPARRLNETQQRQQVDLQRRRFEAYNGRLERQRELAQQRAAYLQQQRRLAQYRYQQEYLRRLYEQQRWLASYRNYNYNNDPFFYTAPSYRYARGGSYFYVNQYAANLLEEAVQNGYREGFHAGRADREDGWRFDYGNAFAYQDANFGFPGYYVDQSEYNYYFREGFRRGYEDGYYSRSRYGSISGSNIAILGAVLGTILTLQAID